MNAIKFIKEHGVEKAREVVNVAPDRATTVKPSLDFKHFMYGICENAAGAYILLSDLKRLVESVDLIKSCGGIINAKYDVKHLDLDWDYDTPRVTRLRQAIADYESIYSDNMGDDSHIENHVSPNCKKFDERVGNNETNQDST